VVLALQEMYSSYVIYAAEACPDFLPFDSFRKFSTSFDGIELEGSSLPSSIITLQYLNPKRHDHNFHKLVGAA
jgi:hypothetical protein